MKITHVAEIVNITHVARILEAEICGAENVHAILMYNRYFIKHRPLIFEDLSCYEMTNYHFPHNEYLLGRVPHKRHFESGNGIVARFSIT